MKKVQATQRTTQNWIAENDACMRSLWLRRNGFSVCLVAKTKEPPVSLLLPLDSCFDVRILRIDYTHGFIFARPLAEDDHYRELQQKLIKHSSTKHVRAENLNEDTIYLASNNGHVFRGTLIVRFPCMNSSSSPSFFKEVKFSIFLLQLYGIDIGDMKFINAQSICKLPADLQSIPPLCFCGFLPSCTTSFEYEDLSLINENSICLCKIYKVLPPHFSDYPTVMYPPVVFIQLYKFTGVHNKYVEVIFRRKSRTIINNTEYFGSQCAASRESLIRKRRNDRNIEKINVFQRTLQSYDQFVKSEDNVACSEVEYFTFKPYSIKLPSQIRAIVTAKIRQNIYWMRDVDILSILFENLVDPGKHSKYKALNQVGWHDEISCLVRLKKPFRKYKSYDRFSVYRAIVTNFHDDTCLAYLVDFGTSIICNTKNLYNFKEQPAVIREISSAAFRCYVNQVLQRGSNERKTSKLLREKLYTVQLLYLHDDFYVCDIVSGTQYSKRESESESIGSETRNKNAKNLTSENTSTEVASGAISDEDFNMERSNQLWFQSQPNSLCLRNKSARNQVTLTSIQLDVLKISEKIDNITKAKLASSIHMQSCQQSDQNPAVPMIESVYMQQFRFDELSNDLGIPKSDCNLHGKMDINQNTTHVARNRNGCWRRKSCRTMKNGQLPSELSQCAQKHMIPSIVPVMVPVAVPLQFSPYYETWDEGHSGRIQFHHYDKHGYEQLNDNKLKIKKTNFHAQMRKRELKSNVSVHKKWQHDKHCEDRPFTSKKILRTFYVRRLRNREGKLLYTSDESSTDETSPGVTQCQPIINDDDAIVENKKCLQRDVPSKLLEKELIPDINELFVKCIPAYQAFFEHVKVNENDEILVKRSDDDHNNKNWPLFFVQIQRDDLLDVLEELDSLQPTTSISEEELQVGTLCLSFCHTFESMFRAVITSICNADIEVYYVDYGNYETVSKDDLKSINDLPDIAHTYPGMAIPCILFNSCIASTLSNYVEVEDEIVTKLKGAVSCEHHSFRIRILKIREDGICIVKYISS
ncbi:Tudor domain-containing protein [Dirofilaria immitis]